MNRAGTFLAVIILVLITAPWPVPTPEVVLERFVPDRITIDPRGTLGRPGRVDVAPRELVLSAGAYSQPTVHVLTTEVPFTVTFLTSVIKRNAHAFPLQVKVWHPRTEVALEIWYAPDGAIIGGTRADIRWRDTRRLGVYTIGGSSAWDIRRDDRHVTVEITGQGSRVAYAVSREEFPALFEPGTLSLTIYASVPSQGSSTAVVRDPVLRVPRQTRYGTTVDSPWFRPAIGLVALLSLAWLMANIGVHVSRPRLPRREMIVIGLLVASSVLIGWLLSRIPGHPVDVRTVELWTAIAREHGLAAIVGHSFLTTEGGAHGGLPYAAPTFPYPPLLTYLFWTVGKLSSVGHAEQTFKMLAILGLVAGGGVLYGLLRRLRVTPGMSAVATAAYVLNPAMLFDGAVWGQTDAFVGLFLLIGTAGAVLETPAWLWGGTLLAALTKQTGVLCAPVIIGLGLFRMGFRRMAQGAIPAILIAFLVLTPAFLSGTHPSAVYRPVVTKVLAFGTVSGMEVVNAVVSESAFTLWAAATAVEGARTWERMAFPDYVPSRFGASYFVLSRGAFLLFVALLGLALFRRMRCAPGADLLLVAAYTVGIVVLLTRVMPRYQYFGVLFAAASLPWMPRWLGAATLSAFSGTMLISLWGMLVFTSIWYPGLAPTFAPERSPLNSAAAAVLGSDIGITLGSILNIAVMVTLLGVWARSRVPTRQWPGARPISTMS